MWRLSANSGDWNGTLTNSLLADIGLIATFGEDANGEVYLAGFSNGIIYRLQDDAPAPVLSISKTAPSGVTAGTPFTYTLTVSNSGNMAATNLVISDTVPAGANYGGGGTLNGAVVTWNVPHLVVFFSAHIDD